MTKLEKSRYGKMRFNPLSEGIMLEEYPILKEIIHPDWESDPNLDGLIRYTILAYDPNSPVFQDEAEINNRRPVAANIANLPASAEFRMQVYMCAYRYKAISEIALIDIAYMPELIKGYLKSFVRSKEHAAIMAVESYYWEMIQKLVSPTTGKDDKAELEAMQKKMLIEDRLPKTIGNIRAMYKDFFGGDEEVVAAVEKRTRYTSENIAHVLKNSGR